MSNHRSIRDEQELLLIPAYDQSRPVVPVVAIFGANASGKSNLLDALRWMREAVHDSFARWAPESGVPRTRCRLAAEDVPTSFTVDLVLDGVQYVYGMTVTSEAVEEEWLHSYPHGRERMIFERKGRSVELGSTVPDRRARADLLAGLMRDNALFLSVAAQAGQGEVMPVHRWFRGGVRFADRASGELAERAQRAIRRFPSFVDLVKVADLGISDLYVAESEPVEPDRAGRAVSLVKTKINRELVFLHGPDAVALRQEDQSDGTLSWTDLLIHALSVLRDGAVMVVDEVDASLHPRLTARLIELFHSPDTNEHGAQLIFTTHDATLLGTSLGDEVLHRDEIWFVEKKDGATNLYPLSDFHPRKGENRERRYLAGSYGAVPAVFEDSLVDAMLATRTDDTDAPA